MSPYRNHFPRFLGPGLLALAFFESPMATACRRDLTTGPPLPLRSSPAFHSRMARAIAFCPLVALLGLASGSPCLCLRFPGGHGLDAIKLRQQWYQRGDQWP